RRGEADAAAAAGDHGDLSIQLAHDGLLSARKDEPCRGRSRVDGTQALQKGYLSRSRPERVYHGARRSVTSSAREGHRSLEALPRRISSFDGRVGSSTLRALCTPVIGRRDGSSSPSWTRTDAWSQ